MHDGPRNHDAHCNHTKAHTAASAASDPFARHPSGPSLTALHSSSPPTPPSSAFCTDVYPWPPSPDQATPQLCDASPTLTECMPLAPPRGLIQCITIRGFISFSSPFLTPHHTHAACSCGPPSPTTWALPWPQCKHTPAAAGLPPTGAAHKPCPSSIPSRSSIRRPLTQADPHPAIHFRAAPESIGIA